MKDLLYKKFKAVPTRPGRGGTYSYIKWQDVADRMNEVFGIHWSSEVIFQDVINSNVVIRVRITVLSTESGDMYYQEGFGGAPMDDRQEAGNPFKAAYSKALKDACKKWGIGLYLEEGEAEIESNLKPFGSEEVVTTQQAPPVIPPQKTEIPMVPTQQAPPVIPSQKTEIPVVPTQQTKAPVTTRIPVTPPQIPEPVHTTVTAKQDTISDVQKAALQSILGMQEVEYSELVKGAFATKDITLSDDGIPTIDNLSYKEAVIVIKYGNDNFRKR